jgi:hypothetical protein
MTLEDSGWRRAKSSALPWAALEKRIEVDERFEDD